MVTTLAGIKHMTMKPRGCDLSEATALLTMIVRNCYNNAEVSHTL